MAGYYSITLVAHVSVRLSYVRPPVFSILVDNLGKCQRIFTKLSVYIAVVDIWFGIAKGQISSIFDSYLPVTWRFHVFIFCVVENLMSIKSIEKKEKRKTITENKFNRGIRCSDMPYIKVKTIAFGNKERITDRKWESRFHWDSSLAVMKFATLITPASVHEQNSIFKDTIMGPMIPKEMKYNLHYGDLTHTRRSWYIRRVANNVDPDQTPRPRCLSMVYTVCSGMSLRILREYT